jgi:hypothetical protein
MFGVRDKGLMGERKTKRKKQSLLTKEKLETL